jgi:LacI family transcriptional regulator
MALAAGNRVRQKDIARDANVSVMTVSKVVRGCADVAPATRRRILARIKELNYRPHWVARSLVAGRTFTIGLVIPDLMCSFFAEISKSIANTIRPLGYELILCISEEDPALEGEDIERLIERQIDGLIIAPAQSTSLRELTRRLQKANVPLVLVDRHDPDVRAGYVGVDDKAIGRLATTHLIECGCRRIAHIFGSNLSPAAGRREGYLEALNTHGLSSPESYLIGAADERSGCDAARRLLSLDPPPDSIFAFNDPIAAGAINAILEAGYRVPEDIKVVGVGNTHFSDLLRVPLSTIDQSSAAIGEQAANMLVEAIGAQKVRRSRTVELEPVLIVRDSTLRRAG